MSSANSLTGINSAGDLARQQNPHHSFEDSAFGPLPVAPKGGQQAASTWTMGDWEIGSNRTDQGASTSQGSAAPGWGPPKISPRRSLGGLKEPRSSQTLPPTPPKSTGTHLRSVSMYDGRASPHTAQKACTCLEHPWELPTQSHSQAKRLRCDRLCGMFLPA